MIVLPETWMEHLEGRDIFKRLFGLEGRVYREEKSRKTLRFTLLGKHYFAKLHQGVGWTEIIKNLLQFRLPVLGAQNEWRAIKRLEQSGIRTMALVGYGKRGWNPARLQSFVVTEELTDTLSLEDFCRDWPNSPPAYTLKRGLIREVARIARTLHENGMNHRDFYICHFLVHVLPGQERMDPGRTGLYLIDLHRMQIRSRTPSRRRIKDLGALYFSSMDIGLTRRDLLRFIREYGKGGLRESLGKNRFFWQRVEKRGEALHRKFIRKYPEEVRKSNE